MKSLLLSSVVLIGSSYLAFSEPVIMPVQPDSLLSALPLAPSNWKLLSSSASNELMGSRDPVTIATRRYEIQLEDKSVDPHIVKTLLLRLVAMDTGSRTETVENFRSQLSLAGQGVDARQKIDFGSGVFGAFSIPSEGIIKCDALCGDRLALQIEMQGANEKEFVSVFKALDFAKLASLARRLPNSLNSSGRFTLFIVDELDPKKNRSYQVGTVDFSKEVMDSRTNSVAP
jgi:hypothetical protein